MRTADMPVLELTGSARNRGRIHGESMRADIGACIEAVWEEIGAKSSMRPQDYFSEFVTSLPFWNALDAWLPEFKDELLGIAEGASRPFYEVAALNLLDEATWFGRERLLHEADPTPGTGLHSDRCSVIAIRESPSGATLLAQNMDMSTWTEGRQALLHVKLPESEHEYFAFATAGLLGTCGLNNRGVGLCVNSIVHLDHAPAGFPVAAVVRKILESPDIAAAIESISSVTHASGQSYTLGSHGRIATFECATDLCVPYWTWSSHDRIVHANHALANIHTTRVDSQADEARRKRLPRFLFHPTRNSLARQGALERQIGDFHRPVDMDGIKRVLASTDDPLNPLCRGGEEVQRTRNVPYTTGSVIWELGATVSRAHIAAGPPNVSEFMTFSF